jgi:uncharacterized membrane protein YecN with MAPEG domain
MPSRPAARQLPLYIIAGTFLYLCCNVFSWRGTPFLLGGDEQVFWMNALRMQQGELIYRDFFEFTPPGTDLVYLAAFKLLGARIWATNVMLLLLGTSLVGLCFANARRVLPGAEAALAAGLFLVLDFGHWLDGTHHWFSVLSVMIAILVLSRHSSAPRIMVSGALLGLASFFTQTRGVAAAAGFLGFLLWSGFREQTPWRVQAGQLLRLLLPLAVTWSVLSAWFIFKLGISTLYYFQVVYVLEYVANKAQTLFWLEHPWLPAEQLVYFGAPFVYALSLWRSWKAPADAARSVALLAFAGAALFLEVAQSPNSLRVEVVVMPAVILSVWLVSGLFQKLRGGVRWRAWGLALTWLVLVAAGAHQVWIRNSTRTLIVDLPAGRAATVESAGTKLAWLARHTTPGELFFQASYQSLYLPLGLRNPAYDYLDRSTSPEFAARDLRQLASQRVRYVLWSPLDQPRYPAFEQFLSERYHWVWRFPDGDEIWELK